ncbi:MAG: hypothetical protein DRN92_09600 [Thermoproteota archaeon]|nr:MAG: hypothetical protein DRN92_09600 [Candidatus Korarchaeota archaeon]
MQCGSIAWDGSTTCKRGL